MYDWNDLRHFLAVARTGSTLAAARELGVNQTTVARRIAALEEALGTTLFERRQGGYLPTENGRSILDAAGRVEDEAAGVLDVIAARERRIAGTVRVTTNLGMSTLVLMPSLREFRTRYPEIRVETVIDDRRLDIARGEADVALRAGSRPTEARVVARKLMDVGWTVYCSRDYATLHGIPKSVGELNRHVVIGGDGPLAALPGPRWLADMAPQAKVEYRSNNLTSLISAVDAGLGIATLPCMVEVRGPNLVRCLPPVPELNSELWLVTHEDLRHLPHIRAFMDFISAHLAALAPQMTGLAPAPEP